MMIESVLISPLGPTRSIVSVKIDAAAALNGGIPIEVGGTPISVSFPNPSREINFQSVIIQLAAVKGAFNSFGYE